MSRSYTHNRTSKMTHDAARSSMESSKQYVGQHALSTAVAAFGLGIGAGVALVFLLSESRQQQEMGVVNRLGRHVLDAMSSAVPNQLTNLGR
jgi:hypothetical protein